MSECKVSVPGSIMLMGEHAVLDDRLALVMAINRRILVSLVPTSDGIIEITSERFGHFSHATATICAEHGVRDSIPDKNFSFAVAALQEFRAPLRAADGNIGCKIEIHSEFSAQVGFGSSAAVTLALVAVLSRWLGLSEDYETLYSTALHAVLKVQTVASGADVVASLYGGVVAYRKHPFYVKCYDLFVSHIAAVYCGYKRATPVVVKKVLDCKSEFSTIFEHLFDSIEACVTEGVQAIEQKNWARLGKLFDIHQGLSAALGVSNCFLATLLYDLRAANQILGAKISGAGLGDCIIGVGELAEGTFPLDEKQHNLGVCQFNLQPDFKGLHYVT